MQGHVEDAKKDIGNEVKSHYSTYTDRVQLLQGSYSHLTTVSEWSLDGVNKMIDAIKDALFGKKATPAGTEKEKVSESTSKSIAALNEFDLLIASAAFEVIQGILAAFASSTKTEVTKITRNKKVAPGVNLFISVLDSSYQRSTFLDNQMIVQNMYVFEVHYSSQEGLIDAKRGTLQTYMDEKESWIGQIKKIADLIDKLVPGDDLNAYQKQINTYDQILDGFNVKMQKIDAEIAKLTKLAQNQAVLAARVPSHGLAIKHLQQKAAALLDTYGGESTTIVAVRWDAKDARMLAGDGVLTGTLTVATALAAAFAYFILAGTKFSVTSDTTGTTTFDFSYNGPGAADHIMGLFTHGAPLSFGEGK
jgi:hypothetical protein